MSGELHEAWSGFISDHLYVDCPAMTRMFDRPSPFLSPDYGTRLPAGIDPESPDVCSMCHQRWTVQHDAV